jgi:RING finger/CHY zinc finger protein 1
MSNNRRTRSSSSVAAAAVESKSSSPQAHTSIYAFDPQHYSKALSSLYTDENKEILGCSHYSRGCKIRGPCCDDFYSCRLCHNEAVDSHEINRHAIKEMICLHCVKNDVYNIQPVSQSCAICSTQLAQYYCAVCKLFDDDSSHQIFHCEECGICRRGRREEFFHCSKCSACYSSTSLARNHKCIENVLSGNCSICIENLFHSTKPLSFMRCGHAIHCECLEGYILSGNITCPECKKSIIKSAHRDEQIENYLAINPMPEEYKDYVATILCNDCLKKCEVPYHFAFHRCCHCNSFNTDIIHKDKRPHAQINNNVNDNHSTTITQNNNNDTTINNESNETDTNNEREEESSEEQ